MKNRKIPRSYYEKIRGKIRWDEILSKLGIRFKGTVKLGQSGFGLGNYKCLCIFHKEKTASLVFFENSGRFHCFGCGESGDIFDFISLYISGGRNNLSKTCRWLKKCFDINLPW